MLTGSTCSQAILIRCWLGANCNVDSCWTKWMYEIPTCMAARWKGNSENKLIDMAFNKGRADDRKTWMNKYQALNWNSEKWWNTDEKMKKMLINCGNINQDISGCCPDSRHEASFACRGFNMVKWNPGGGYFCRPLQASRLIWGLCARLRTSGNRDVHRLPSSSIRFFQFGMRRVRWTKSWFSFLAMILGMQQFILGYARQFLWRIVFV